MIPLHTDHHLDTNLGSIEGYTDNDLGTPQALKARNRRGADQTISGEERNNLERARPMLFETSPATAKAKNFATLVADRAGQWEQLKRSRRYRRGAKKQRQHVEAAGKVVGDLLIAASRDAMRWSSRSLRANSFTGSPVSYRQYMAIREAMLGLGWIEEHPGYFEVYGNWELRRSRRLRATPELLRLAQLSGIDLASAEMHFPVSLPAKPLILKAASKRLRGRKASGREISFSETPRTREMASEIRELDEFIAKHDLEGGIHRGYRRIFNQGDQIGFRWNKGGRLYSVGDDSYQTLKKAQRLQMRIDGEPVVEIDIRASYLTILYALLGLTLDQNRDPYDVPGLPRDVVKAWITMTIGHDKFHKRWPAKSREELFKRGIDVEDYKLAHVQERVLAAHPILRSWPVPGIDGFDLMFSESEAILATMLTLKRDHGVVCLSVHDSIIVPASAQSIAEEVLKTEYAKAIGVTPSLKVNTPTPKDGVLEAAA